MSALVKSGSTIEAPAKAGTLSINCVMAHYGTHGTLVHMIEETVPELQKLSTADKFALAVELWDELSSNPDEIPVTEAATNQRMWVG
jgi:hypothetical protein